jgi:restriction endonuclease S subunit
MTDREARADDFLNYKLVEPGDIVVNRMRAFEGGAGISAFRGIVSSDYAVLRTRPGLDPRFLHYLIRSHWFIAEMTARLRGIGNAELGGVRTPRINVEDLGNIVVLVPPTEEQRAIASYLEKESARAALVIGAMRRALTLIAERRTSLIVSAFSRPAFPGRGATIRALAEPLLGRQRSPDQATGPHMVRYLRAANVKDGRLDLNDVMEMNFTPEEQATFALLPGDVLITEGAGSLAAVGANAVWDARLQGTICFQNTLIRLRPRPDSDPRFVAWWARYAFEAGLFAAEAGGANIFHIGVDTVRGMPAWVPPIEVQRDLASELDRAVSRLDQQASARERQVDLLEQRHRTLVSDAVTGRLKIAGVAA